MSSFYGNGGGIAQGGGNILAEKMYICGVSEYDTSTGLPSIVDPEQGMFYLVPAGDEEENNLFNQFIYKDGEWEKFGSGGLKLDDLVVIAGTGTGSAMTKNGNTASGEYSFAEGNGTIASGYSSHAEGANTTASSNYSHAEGYNTKASGTHSHAEGSYTIASGMQSHAEGINTKASGSNSHAEGSSSNFSTKTINNVEYTKAGAYGRASHSEGENTLAIGNYSHVEGGDTTASGINSHAEGVYTTASGINSHSEGNYTTASGSDSHAEGSNTQASGGQSHAEGSDTQASGTVSHAEGYETVASGAQSHAEGQGGKFTLNNIQYISGAKNSASHSEGYQTVAESMADHSEGYHTRTLNYPPGNHAEGYETAAIGGGSHAEGYRTTASASYSHAEGDGTKASGVHSHAEGGSTIASGYGSHAEGQYTVASGSNSHASGYYTAASGNGSYTEGNYFNLSGSNLTNSQMRLTGNANTQVYTYNKLPSASNIQIGNQYFFDNKLVTVTALNTTNKTITVNETLNTSNWTNQTVIVIKPTAASGQNSHAEGYQTIASGPDSHAEGASTTASGFYSHAEGAGTVASNSFSHAEGERTTASGTYSHAEGNNTIAAGIYSHAEGVSTTASGNSSHAEGNDSTASGNQSHAEGGGTEASGAYSHTEGSSTIASKTSSHAEGTRTKAFGQNSHAEGIYTTASGDKSHAEGDTTTASGNSSHAEGIQTTASGSNSHAEGGYTTASGNQSHTEGIQTTASGIYSHAEGNTTIANHRAQHVFGEYNIADSSTATAAAKGNYVEIVGNGTSTSTRSNARTLDWSGNEVLAGKLTVGTGPTENMDVATKQYVDEHAGGSSGLQNLIDGSTTGSVKSIYSMENADIGQYAFAGGYNSIASGAGAYTEGNYMDNAALPSQIRLKLSGEKNTLEYTVDLSDEFNSSGIEALGLVGWFLIENQVAEVANLEISESLPNTGIITFKETLNPESDWNERETTLKICMIAKGISSHAEGVNTVASGISSHAEGFSVIASGYTSHAEGDNTRASNNFSHAEGEKTTASGLASHTQGALSIASGEISHAEGLQTVASGSESHAEGSSTTASGGQSHAEGSYTTASGDCSHAEGENTTASGFLSHTEGFYTIANHASQHVFGEYNIEDPSTAIIDQKGNYVEIVGNGTSSIRSNARTLDWNGNEVLAGKLTVGTGPTNDMDVATKQYVDQHSSSGGSGLQNLIDGSTSGSVRSINSKAEDSNYTIGSNAIAEGYNTKASGSNSHAEGSNTTASGGQSHAEGAGTVASSSFSHAEGERTTASGGQAHSEGAGTTASGDCSHAEGGWTTASGYYSHAEGVSTIANHRAQRVFGTYNIEDPSTENNETNGNYIEIVGNGTDNATRSNARTLDWLGNEILAGKLTVGSDPVNNMDVTTKQYVDKIFTDAVKQALLNCFAHVAWTDGNGQTYYDALNQALYPIDSISATFNQGSATIMEDDPLSNLKQYLTVNAVYLDEHTEEVTDYTLSGELIDSTSEITVTYQGKTATFNVTVTPVPVLNVNIGKGISYDTTQVVTNAKRCISDKVPFVNTAPIKVQWKENTDYRWALKNETAAGAMDSTGARWSPDMNSTQAQQDSSLDGWIFSGEEQTKQTSEPYASTSGYCRILFAPLAGMTADLPATRPSGYMTITGTKYRLQAVES